LPENEVCFWTQPVGIKGWDYDLTLAVTARGLCRLGLGRALGEEEALAVWVRRWYPGYCLIRSKEVKHRFIKEIEEYLMGKRQIFTVPLDLKGTPFQVRVWEELCRIPYGQTRSYSFVAQQIGCPKGCRAVGSANNKNPLPLIIPCHRVLGQNGSLTGYRGGLDLKLKILQLEGVKI
jgi:methylated-DNA-[protein]-cysteine S-methyltransferase